MRSEYLSTSFAAKNGVINDHKKCNSNCIDCIKHKDVCIDCERKGHKNIEPKRRACDYCMKNKEKCNKVAVICVSQDSESRNSGGQKILMEEKNENTNPSLNILSTIADAVHVTKCKQQGFSNWFLWVNDVRINLVQLQELRNDPSLYLELLK